MDGEAEMFDRLDHDPKDRGTTREQFLDQADQMVEAYVLMLQVSPITTPDLVNRVLTPQCANREELLAALLATSLQKIVTERWSY